MKKLQILALMILLAANGMHASDGELYPNPFDSQFDDNEHIQLRGDSFQQAINQKDEHGYTFLHRGVKLNDIQEIEKLIKFGADVNSQCRCGNTPLHGAVWGCRHAVIRLLLKAGADTTIRNNDGYTARQWITDLITTEIFDEAAGRSIASQIAVQQNNSCCSIS